MKLFYYFSRKTTFSDTSFFFCLCVCTFVHVFLSFSLSHRPSYSRKFIVNITGMEKFNLKLKDAGKALSKKYACSATVTKNAMNQKEIVMSGNIGYDIAENIHKLWKHIPMDAIIVEMKKSKKGGPKQPEGSREDADN